MPLLWAVAMPCDYDVCNQVATLTYSDDPETSYPITQSTSEIRIQGARNFLRNVGVLDDPDDPIPQCNDPTNPNQQRVALFIQDCSPNACRYLTLGVEAILSFEVCPVCQPGEEFCEPQPRNPECLIGIPARLDPKCFINQVGLGGLVTLEIDLFDDPPSDADFLDYGDFFELPPPPRPDIPTVSEWGLVIMTILLLAGLKIKFGRFRQRKDRVARV